MKAGSIHTESEKGQKKKETVQTRSSPFLSKEHEMNGARITRKNSLPPLGSGKDSIWQRGRGLLLRKEGSNSRAEKNQRIIKLLIFGEFHFCSKTEAGNVSTWDWWNTSSSDIALYIKLTIIIIKTGHLII